MKKLSVLLVVAGLLLAGCGSKKGNSTKTSDTASASSSKTIASTTKESTSPKDSTTESTTPASSTQATTAAATTTNDPLAAYSDLQIEYARVWLAVFGAESLNDPDFRLNVVVNPAGQPIDIYDAGSVNYPVATTTLTGNYMAAGLIVYSSNHDGTITKYAAPSHWQLSAEVASNPEEVKQLTQKVLDDATIVAIPAGDSALVEQMIARINIQ